LRQRGAAERGGVGARERLEEQVADDVDVSGHDLREQRAPGVGDGDGDAMLVARGRSAPLWQDGTEGGEAVATMELFKGAIGLFKNPASHRRVDYTDATEAAEVVLLADLLMRLLDKIEPRTS
jgi:hypothetical protein